MNIHMALWITNESPDWFRNFSLIPDEDERSHYVVYANVSQMLLRWIMIKEIEGNKISFIWLLAFIFTCYFGSDLIIILKVQDLIKLAVYSNKI